MRLKKRSETIGFVSSGSEIVKIYGKIEMSPKAADV